MNNAKPSVGLRWALELSLELEIWKKTCLQTTGNYRNFSNIGVKHFYVFIFSPKTLPNQNHVR